MKGQPGITAISLIPNSQKLNTSRFTAKPGNLESKTTKSNPNMKFCTLLFSPKWRNDKIEKFLSYGSPLQKDDSTVKEDIMASPSFDYSTCPIRFKIRANDPKGRWGKVGSLIWHVPAEVSVIRVQWMDSRIWAMMRTMFRTSPKGICDARFRVRNFTVFGAICPLVTKLVTNSGPRADLVMVVHMYMIMSMVSPLLFHCNFI